MSDELDRVTQKNQEELEEQLIRNNYGLVVSQALLFFKDTSKHYTLEDCIQVGLVGLLKSIRKHDPKKSKFPVYATVCIKNAISSFVKKHNKKNKVVFDTKALNSLLNARHYVDKDNIASYLTKLNEQELFIITKKIENYTNSEICEILSCTRNALKNKITDIINKLEEHNK